MDISNGGSCKNQPADWETDCEYADIHFGRAATTGACGSGRGVVHRRSGSRERISEPGGADGGAVCEGSVCGGTRRADVPDGRSWKMAARWDDRVPRTE